MLLQALMDDLQAMRDRFDSQRVYNEAMLGAAIQLLDAGASRSTALSPDDVDKLLGNIVWYNTYTSWQSASMDLLVSSGDLTDLTDLNLIQLLLALHNRLESAQRRYRLDETFYRDRLIPFLGTHANLPQILAAIDHAPGVAEWSYDFPEIDIADTTDHSRLLSDDAGRSVMDGRFGEEGVERESEIDEIGNVLPGDRQADDACADNDEIVCPR